MRLRIDTLDDLWTLRNLVQEGDLAIASTTRSAETTGDKIREGKAEKRRMTLGVRVATVEWHDFDDHLRIHGVIEEGPQDHGRHHTLVVRDDGNDLTVRKRGPLQGWHLDQVREAEAASARPQVLLLSLDDEEAQFAVLRGYGVQWLGSVPAGGQGKRFEGTGDAKRRFHDEVLKSLRALRSGAQAPLLVVGPGWWREEFLAYAGEKAPDLVAGAQTDGTSQGGRAGIQEALRRGQIERVFRDHRVHVETGKVEAVFLAMADPRGLAAVGAREVEQAVQAGAAEEVLVVDDVVRHGDRDDLLRLAEQTGCDVHIVASGHEAGERLRQIGGVAALLRFRP